MQMKSACLLFIFVTLSSFLLASEPVGELTHDGPATPEQISLYMPILESVSEAGIAQVNYKKSGDSNWLVAHPLHRIRPEYATRKLNEPAYAGVIWDLSPNTKYDVEVKLKINGKDITRKASFTTRDLPPKAGAATKTIAADSDQKTIQSTLNDAKPGDVIEFKKGTYNVKTLQIKTGGTIEKPVYIRGESRTETIINAPTGTIIQILECSNVVIENLTLEGSNEDSGVKSSSKGIVFWTAPVAQENFTFRNLIVRGVDMGIMASNAIKGVLVYDNTVLGNNVWEKDIITTNSTWNDDGIRVPGQGNSVFNNTLKGFGDTFAINDRVFNSGVHFYRNEVLMTGDDAFECDYGHRNITFYDNRIQNSQTFLSMDPIIGGPTFCFRNISINVGRGPYKLNSTNTGMYIYNNTVIRTNGFGSGKDWGWVQFNNGNIQSWAYCNNILVWKGQGGRTYAMEARGQTELDFTNNAWYPDGSFWWTGTGGSAKSLAEVFKLLPETKPTQGESKKRHENDFILDDNPFAEKVELGENFLTEITKRYEPALAKESNAKHKGRIIPGVTDGFSGKAPDVGAVIEGRPTAIRGDRTK